MRVGMRPGSGRRGAPLPLAPTPSWSERIVDAHPVAGWIITAALILAIILLLPGALDVWAAA